MIALPFPTQPGGNQAEINQDDHAIERYGSGAYMPLKRKRKQRAAVDPEYRKKQHHSE